MRLHQNRKKILCALMTLIFALTMAGINIHPGYAGNSSVQASLTSPQPRQIFQPGSSVELAGTAQGLREVSIIVRNEQGGLVYTAQPEVENGLFATSFTLEPGAAEGEYTITLSGLGLSVKRYKFEVSKIGTEVALQSPSSGQEFKAGDVVEIAGTATRVSQLAISVLNSQNGRVYVAQPAVVDGNFMTRFTLATGAMTGEYTIQIKGAGLTGAQTYHFKVTSTGGGDPGGEDPKPDAILFINGNAVTKKISYTRAELAAMNQERKVLSATSDFPENLVVAVEGVPLRTLLEQAGINWGSAQKITFKGTDGYTAEFTINELFNQKRYIFPSMTEVEPIVALKRAERTSNFNDMSEQDTPVVCYGQRAQTEQTLQWFVKRLKTITVTTDVPGKWSKPTAKIITPGSKQKVATQGGEVEKGSEIYLYCSEPIPRIYYTTDGSTPDLNSKIFNLHGCGPLVGKDPPIKIDKTTTIKAMAVGRGNQNSEISTFTFTVAGTQPGGGGGGGGGAGGGTVPQQTVAESNIKIEELNLENNRKGEKLTLQPGVLEDIEKAQQGSRLAIDSTGNVDEVRIEATAAMLQKAQEKSMLLGINSRIANYTLPLAPLNLNEAAAGLGVKPQELKFKIIISKATQELKNKLNSKLQAEQQMLVEPVEFRIEITAPNGKKTEYKSFGTTYLERELPLQGELNVKQATGVVWQEAKERFLPLPTRFATRDGQNLAVILNRSNSLYTVLQTGKTFADIQSHWARADIELLAAKMIISGKSQTTYEPDSNVTRAEFAALLVRVLGLEEKTLQERQFKDVSAGAWYAGSVAAATAENIIKGYDGNLFKPDEKITREEMAVMIARTARVAGKDATLSDSEQEQQLAQFTDQQKISSWATNDVALAVKAGIIKGLPGGEFAPQTNADRAQSATILKRFLTHINFIAA